MKLYQKLKHREIIRFDEKLRIFTLIIVAGFSIFILRLAYMQIIAGSDFRLLSDKNRIRLLRLKAPRGLVFDCRGKVLVDNRPSFSVSLIPAEASNPQATLVKLREFLDFDEDAMREEIRASKYVPFRQISVARDVTIEQAGMIEECSLDLPGVIITAEPCRRFPLGQSAAHVLGYLGEVSPDQLERLSDQGYLMGDYIGKAGVELVAERWLHGEDGGVQVQVYADGRPQMELDPLGNPSVGLDTAGRRLVMLGKKLATCGHVLRLTIDSDMQQIAEAEMTEDSGAVIVMDANTGAIRALVSKPSFDPNIFVSSDPNKQRLTTLTDPMHPLLNRALQAYAPGSTFKIITAYAGLCEGVITPETRLTCTGSLNVGRTFRCWKDHGHGSLNVVQALAYSCDVFFYNVGLRLGIDRMAKYARMFGLGEPSGIDLPGEMRGIVPSTAWKTKTFKNPADQKWYDGETVNAAIGQGYTMVTPLQMARVMAAIANGGKLVKPYLIDTVEARGSEEVAFAQQPETANVLNNAATVEIIKSGLSQVVTSRAPFYGTAWRAMNDTVPLMGKTGTAQVAGFKERADTAAKLEKIPYEQRDHAWFISAVDDPEHPLVIVAFCEHAGHGSESSVPIVRQIAIRIFKEVLHPGDEASEEESKT